jgi:thiol-disulfide isomerase/thioredoxin
MSARNSVTFLFSVVLVVGGAACDQSTEVQVAAPEKKIGYDLRMLRPGEQKLDEQFDAIRSNSVGEGKRVAVLFSADWCAPCKKLEAELGNTQPASQIGDVRIVMVKEEDWRDATRMKEFDGLRLRWSPAVGAFPLFIMLDDEGNELEEMKKAIPRLEGEDLEPTIANWFSHPPLSSNAS